MEFLNLSHREKSNGARAREGGGDRERERKGEGVERGAKVKRVKGAPNTMAHNQ